jgi:DNA-directed RNA polymerase specialized sigma24 family protein
MPHHYDQHSLEELQRLFHNGDQAAIGELVRRYDAAFRSLALRWAGGDEDIATDAFGDLLDRLRKPRAQACYDPTRPWEPWARRLLRNAVIDCLRREVRRRASDRAYWQDMAERFRVGPDCGTEEMDPFNADDYTEASEAIRHVIGPDDPRLAGPTADPAGCTDKPAGRLAWAIRACLETLGAERRELLVGRFFRPQCGRTPDAVRQRLKRTLGALRDCVSSRLGGIT